MQKTSEETALSLSLDIDTRAFMWTFDCLDEDHELERFFSGLPGLRNSKIVHNLLLSLPSEQESNICQASIGLLDRTLSSDLLPEDIKKRRTTICAKAINPAHLPSTYYYMHFEIFCKYQYSCPLATGIVEIVRSWKNDGDEATIFEAQAIITMIIARVQPRDKSWFILASNELGVSEAVLRNHGAHGDSFSLAFLIHIVRQQFINFGNPIWPRYMYAKVLEAASKLNVQDTSSELQHEFCALWNQIVHHAQDVNDRWKVFRVLGWIRDVYIALHQDSDSTPARFPPSTNDEDGILRLPPSYPLCNIPAHHLDLAPHIHDDSASTTFALAVPPKQHNTAPILSSRGSPNLLPSSINALPHVDDNFPDVPPLENNISPPVPLQPAIQTIDENCRIRATSPNLVITRATHRNIDPSSGTTPLSTPERSASTPPKLKASTPPVAITAENTTVSLIPSPGQDVPLSLSPAPVFDDMVSTGALLSSDSRVAGYKHACSLIECNSRQRPSSAFDMGAAAEA